MSVVASSSVSMGIPVEHEDIDSVRDMGVSGLLEHCHFCKAPTRYWYLPTNDPCCQMCAKEHSVGELENKAKVN